MIIRALKLQGASFTESGRFTGVLPMLGRFLLDAGCASVKEGFRGLMLPLTAWGQKRIS